MAHRFADVDDEAMLGEFPRQMQELVDRSAKGRGLHNVVAQQLRDHGSLPLSSPPRVRGARANSKPRPRKPDKITASLQPKLDAGVYGSGKLRRGRRFDQILRELSMGLLLRLIIPILLFGGGGGDHGYRSYGGPDSAACWG